MNIEIRRATLDDLDLLMQWRMEVLHDVFDVPADDPMAELTAENRAYYERELPTEGHIACFALLDGEIVGCGGICLYHEMPSPDNGNGGCAYLMNIYTRPAYRGQGIAKETCRWLIAEAQARGYTKVFLETSVNGRALYESLGFSDMQDYMKL